MELKGRVVIVTGAVGAIGRGICTVLADEGMKVVVAALASRMLSKESITEKVKALDMDRIIDSGGSISS